MKQLLTSKRVTADISELYWFTLMLIPLALLPLGMLLLFRAKRALGIALLIAFALLEAAIYVYAYLKNRDFNKIRVGEPIPLYFAEVKGLYNAGEAETVKPLGAVCFHTTIDGTDYVLPYTETQGNLPAFTLDGGALLVLYRRADGYQIRKVYSLDRFEPESDDMILNAAQYQAFCGAEEARKLAQEDRASRVKQSPYFSTKSACPEALLGGYPDDLTGGVIMPEELIGRRVNEVSAQRRKPFQLAEILLSALFAVLAAVGLAYFAQDLNNPLYQSLTKKLQFAAAYYGVLLLALLVVFALLLRSRVRFRKETQSILDAIRNTKLTVAQAYLADADSQESGAALLTLLGANNSSDRVIEVDSALARQLIRGMVYNFCLDESDERAFEIRLLTDSPLSELLDD